MADLTNAQVTSAPPAGEQPEWFKQAKAKAEGSEGTADKMLTQYKDGQPADNATVNGLEARVAKLERIIERHGLKDEEEAVTV